MSISSAVAIDDGGIIKTDRKLSDVCDISHITCKFCKSTNLPNPDQTVLVRFGFFTLTGSFRFEFYVFFCMSVLVQFGSAKMRVLVRFVRFDSHL